MNRWTIAAAGAALALAALYALAPSEPEPKCPGPDCPNVTPQPTPAPAPAPRCPNCPRWGDDLMPAVAGNVRVYGEDADPSVDLLAVPGRKPNIASRGLGCCVFRSLEYSGMWQNVPALHGFPEWMVSQNIEGGGYPSKVRDLVPKIAASRNLPAPRYVQYEGSDPSVIELALKTGRCPAITWGGNHMLSCVHLDATQGAIVDNNSPGRVQWMPRNDFLRKWTQGGGGWVVVLLDPGPPPPPRNQRRPAEAAPPAARGANPCDCPEGCPECKSRCDIRAGCQCGAATYGVEWTFGGAEVYEVDGYRVNRRDFEEQLADDSARPHLTLVGTPEAAKAALAGVDQARYRVQSYRPDAWELRAGFSAGAGGAAYLQRPDGTVLLRRDTLDGLADALRRADPSYDPKKDPDGGGKLSPISKADLERYAPWAAGAAAIGGAYWLATRGRADTGAPAPSPARTPAPAEAPLDLERELGRRLIRRRLDDLLSDSPPTPKEK